MVYTYTYRYLVSIVHLLRKFSKKTNRRFGCHEENPFQNFHQDAGNEPTNATLPPDNLQFTFNITYLNPDSKAEDQQDGAVQDVPEDNLFSDLVWV
jgi:outer membrane receptor for ferrienterochelin and colicin